MIREAVISGCGRYRYRLYRRWWDTPEGKPVLWVMLNPSKADDKIDDPTIRRCISFSQDWGYGSMWVGNLTAHRTSNPDELPKEPDLHEDLMNSVHLYDMVKLADKVVVAWGTRGRIKPPRILGPNLWCLGRTLEGHPRHPLYLPWNTQLEPYGDRALGLMGLDM